MPEIHDEDLRIDVFRTGLNLPVYLRVTHLPTGTVAEASHKSQLQAKTIAIQQLHEHLATPMGEPDATAIEPEELLRRWFHWWRTADDVPSNLPDGLHVATAAYLSSRAVQAGRKIYGPHSL